MKRHFAIPLLVAAAIHGGLFFGFSRGEAPARPAAKPYIELQEFPRLPPDEPEVILAPDEPRPRGDPRAFRPAAEDTLRRLELGDFAAPVTPRPPLVDRVVDRIPGDFGLPGGVPSRSGRMGILTAGALDNPPRTRVQTPIAYPYEAKRSGQGGSVTVEFTVDENGRVLDPRVVDSSDRLFEAAALQGVLKWRFEPGRREGRIVRFRMAVPIHFSLNE